MAVFEKFCIKTNVLIRKLKFYIPHSQKRCYIMREPINKRSKIMDKIINTVIFFGSLAIGALRLVSEARRGPGRI